MVPKRYVTAGLLAVALYGCGGDDRNFEEPASEAAVTEARVISLADGEAIAILDAVHGGAAGYAATLADSVTDGELRRLLRVIRADHEALQAELAAIADSLGAPPGVHPVADQVRRSAQDAASASAVGTSDESVVQRQIEFQESLLAVLDSTVVPGTRQPLLARFVAAARPTLGAHLQRAHQVEALLRERATAASAAAAPRPGGPPSVEATPSGEPEPRPAQPEPRPAQPEPRPAEPDTQPPPADPDTTGINR